MGKLPRLARIYIICVMVTATAGLLVGVLNIDWTGSITDMVLAALLVSGIAIAGIYHFHLSYKVEMSLSAAAIFTTVLILGPFLSAWVGALGTLIADVALRKPWFKSLFNTSMIGLSAIGSGLVYWAMGGQKTIPLTSLENGSAIVLAGIAYILINHILVSTVVGLVDGHGPIGIAKAYFKGATFQLIALVPLGTLAAFVYYMSPWGLILLILPALLARYSFESYEKLRMQSRRTIELLADAIDKRDRYTFQHSEKVTHYVNLICKELRLDIQEQQLLLFASRVHDLGKIGIDSNILLKPGKLTNEERAEIERHPEIGAAIVNELALFGDVKDIIIAHQERYDGQGYPKRLAGDEIPLGARIIAVADAFDAMTSNRPYRIALPFEVAMGELLKGRGTQFDPVVVDAFLAVMKREFAEETYWSQTIAESIS